MLTNAEKLLTAALTLLTRVKIVLTDARKAISEVFFILTAGSIVITGVFLF